MIKKMIGTERRKGEKKQFGKETVKFLNFTDGVNISPIS